MMILRHLAPSLLFASILFPIPASGQEPADGEKLHAQVETFLSDFHAFAAAADARRYLDCFREDAVIFGTAPGERYGLTEHGSRITGAFSGGRGLEADLVERNVGVSEDGTTAWFDERVMRKGGLELRDTGVLRRGDAGWKIVLLDKVLPVPNERAIELAEGICKAVPKPPRSIPEDSAAAAALLDYFHAGAECDLERHLGYLEEYATTFGTAADERYTKADHRELLAPYFAAGHGMTSELVVLNITESEDGRFAWFDARLDKKRLCELRGSGLLHRGEDGWKIVLNNLAFPVPNDLIGLTAAEGGFTEPLEVAALREDYALLRKTLEDWHPALYVYESKEDIDRLFEETLAHLTEPMTALEFETLISLVIARVHCVHTRVLPTHSHRYTRVRASTYLPVHPQVIGGRLYVRYCYVDDPALAPGTELLEINGRSAQEVIERLLAVISSDGRIRSQQIAMVNDDFCLLYATHLGSPSSFDLVVRGRNSGEKQDLSLPALTPDRWSAGVQRRGPQPRLGPGRELETEILADEDLAILTHRNFGPADPTVFRSSLEAFFARLADEEIGDLIVDLRLNPGGRPEQGSLLVSYLVNEPYTYFQFDPEKNSLRDAMALRLFTQAQPPAEHHFKGRIFMLIGGRNTSTAGHVISILKQAGRVVFIGQESGATWTCNDNSKDLVLPATGIQVHIARTTYQAAVSGFPPGVGIQPDHEVQPTVEAMLAGRDLEMELARKLAGEEE